MPSPLSPSEPLTARARAALDLGRPAEAVPLLLQALSKAGSGSEGAVIMERLSYALEKTGDKEAALLWADRTLAAAPQWSWAHLRRGDALDALGRTDEAIAELHAARTLSPQMAHLYLRLACIYSSKKDYTQVETNALHFRTLAPDDADGNYYLAEVVLEKAEKERAARRKKWLEQAEKYLNDGLALAPESPYLHRLMGRLRRLQNHYEEALPFYLEAARQMPTSSHDTYNVRLTMDTLLAGRGRLTNRQIAFYLLCWLIQIGSFILHKGAWAAFCIAFLLSFLSDAIVMFFPAFVLRRHAFFRRTDAENQAKLLTLAEQQRKDWKKEGLRILIPVAFALLVNLPLLILRGLWNAGVWLWHK